MTTAKVRADYEQLSAIAQVFGQQAEAVRGVLGRLEKARGVLEGGKWKGKGSAAFYREMSQTVLPAMGRLAAAMSEAARTTRRVSQIMKQAEDDAAALFRLDGTQGTLAAMMAPGAPEPAGPASPMAANLPGGTPFAGVGAAKVAPASSAAATTTGKAKDPRAEQIQPVLDEANHLKEMYDDTVREKWRRQQKYDEAKRLKKPEREVLRLKAELQAMKNAEKYYKEDLTAKYQEAVDLTARLYKIDLSAVKGKPEYFHGTLLCGYTEDDRSVVIGQCGVDRSPGWLASTLGHEAMHARQMKENRSYDEDDNPQGAYMNEIEGYHWELANAARNGLTPDEIESIKRVCQTEYYDKLSPQNKERVNRGIYKPA